MELALLEDTSLVPGGMNEHELKTTPVFTRDAFIVPGMAEILPQRGVLGTIIKSLYVTCKHTYFYTSYVMFSGNSKKNDDHQDPRLYINTVRFWGRLSHHALMHSLNRMHRFQRWCAEYKAPGNPIQYPYSSRVC